MKLVRKLDNIVIDFNKNEIEKAKEIAEKLKKQHKNRIYKNRILKSNYELVGILSQKSLFTYSLEVPDWIASQIEFSNCYDEAIKSDDSDFKFRKMKFDIKGSTFFHNRYNVKWHDKFFIPSHKKLVHKDKKIEYYLFVKLVENYSKAHIIGMCPYKEFWNNTDKNGRKLTSKNYDINMPMPANFIFGGQLYSFKKFIYSP